MNVNLIIFSFQRRKSYQENWNLNFPLTAEVHPLLKKKKVTWTCLKVVIRQGEEKVLILPQSSIRCVSFGNSLNPLFLKFQF